MNAVYLVLVLGVVAVNCLPAPDVQGNTGLVPGVFIPADAFNNLQARANANDQKQQWNQLNAEQPSSNYQNQQLGNQPQPQFQYQPNQENQIAQPAPQQPVLINQRSNPPLIPSSQPILSNQQPLPQGTNEGSGQPNQLILLQQPVEQQPIYVQQPNQQPILLNQQPTQGYVLQNGQPGQLIIANPSNQVPSTNLNQPQNTVYTLIPLNTPNTNQNSGSYLIPFDANSSNSNPIVVHTL